MASGDSCVFTYIKILLSNDWLSLGLFELVFWGTVHVFIVF